MTHTTALAAAVLLVDLAIRVGLSVRVVMRRRPVGTTLAWLLVVLAAPIVGAALYLLVGELRLGSRRARRANTIHGPYLRWSAGLRERYAVDHAALPPEGQPLARLSEATVGIPALPGNVLELGDEAEAILRRLIADIDQAERTCHLEFYIWQPGGWADEVAAALERAAARGVVCRLLVDDVGSRPFLRGPAATRLAQAGVEVRAALPVSLLRMIFVRFDLRLHRKIVVIDGEIAYTGSLNLVDPRYFKREAGVGQWIDAMVRVQGPAVEPLALTFLEDWELETGEDLAQLSRTADLHTVAGRGRASVQVIPSGPLVRPEAIREVLLTAIYSARRELILTTPYFVPDEALLTALVSAAARGVDVTLIVPARVDSVLVRWASRAHFDDLLAAGVRIARFQSGLLHTKSITIDGEYSLFGSLNLDPRSLALNFEITLAVFDGEFTTRLRGLQLSYAAQSTWAQWEGYERRRFGPRLVDNLARLMSPLL